MTEQVQNQTGTQFWAIRKLIAFPDSPQETIGTEQVEMESLAPRVKEESVPTPQSHESNQISTVVDITPLEQIRTEDTSQAEGPCHSHQICPLERGTPLAQSTPGKEHAVTA